jgi:hypothetical protein
MKLRIKGKKYDATFDVTLDNDMEHRVGLTVELHNRDNPDDQWTVEVIDNDGQP